MESRLEGHGGAHYRSHRHVGKDPTETGSWELEEVEMSVLVKFESWQQSRTWQQLKTVPLISSPELKLHKETLKSTHDITFSLSIPLNLPRAHVRPSPMSSHFATGSSCWITSLLYQITNRLSEVDLDHERHRKEDLELYSRIKSSSLGPFVQYNNTSIRRCWTSMGEASSRIGGVFVRVDRIIDFTSLSSKIEEGLYKEVGEWKDSRNGSR